MSRVVAGMVIALATLSITPLSVTATAVAQDDIPEECRTIIGCPDAGPKPEHPGDRGGWAQLMTLAVIVIAVTFILTKVLRAVRTAPGP